MRVFLTHWMLRMYRIQFTGSQESILHMEIEEVAGLGSSDSHDSGSSRRGGVSPLPQIRTSVADRQVYTNKGKYQRTC